METTRMDVIISGESQSLCENEKECMNASKSIAVKVTPFLHFVVYASYTKSSHVLCNIVKALCPLKYTINIIFSLTLSLLQT